MATVLQKKSFVFVALTLSGLFFIITGVQYWLSDYLQVVLNVPSDFVYYYFAFTCLSAPLLGVSIGGIVIGSVGGYNDPRAYLICLATGACGLLVALPIPFLTS